MFMYDIKLLNGAGTTSPARAPFIEQVLAELRHLRSMVLEDVASRVSSGDNGNAVVLPDTLPERVEPQSVPMDVDLSATENDAVKGTENGDSEKEQERKNLINLCKTGLLKL